MGTQLTQFDVIVLFLGMALIAVAPPLGILIGVIIVSLFVILSIAELVLFRRNESEREE